MGNVSANALVHDESRKPPATGVIDVSGRGSWSDLSRRIRAVPDVRLVFTIDWMILDTVIIRNNDPVLARVCSCTRARTLFLQFAGGARILTPALTLRPLGNLERLEKLSIRYAHFDALPRELANSGQTLRRLDLTNNDDFRTVPDWLLDKRLFPRLTDINLNGCATAGPGSAAAAAAAAASSNLSVATSESSSTTATSHSHHAWPRLSRNQSSGGLEGSRARLVEVSSRGTWVELARALSAHDPLSVVRVDWMVLSNRPVEISRGDRVLQALWACRGLQFLSLQFCGGGRVLDEEALRGIGALHHVEQLWLRYLTIPSVPKEILECKKLRRVDLIGNTGIMEVPKWLSDRIPEVNISGARSPLTSP